MNIEEIKKLWGKDLFKVFRNHINEEGWLTEDWSEIIENEVPKFDENWNDNELYKEIYIIMNTNDFEISGDGKFIKPIYNI